MNVGAYIPHSNIRAYVLGDDDNKRADVTPKELEEMKGLVRDGYRAGALGLSTDDNLSIGISMGICFRAMSPRRKRSRRLW